MAAVRTPYILESNPHPFYSFRGLKNQMRITVACGLDSRSRAGFWKNDAAAVRAVRTIKYNIYYFIYSSSSSALQPWMGLGLRLRFRNNIFSLQGEVVSLMPNSQPGRPGYPFLSGSSPLTCLAWEALPVAYATTSILFITYYNLLFIRFDVITHN